MIKKATFFVENKIYLSNEIFNLNNKKLNRDNCLFPGTLLKKEFLKLGFDLSTQDINPIRSSEFVIYSDIPYNHNFENKNSYLIIWESEVILKRNWDKNNYVFFKNIFTWNDALVNDNFFVKINFPHHLIQEKKEVKTLFCCLIAGNKISNHPNELYSRRKEVINWFKKVKPNSLDLYGPNWNRIVTNNKYLNKILLRLNIKIRNKIYKGLIQKKSKHLSKYKFAICFENAKNYPGYITEKIFDCFCSNVVPVYLGPPNILTYIPESCFIDFNKFNSVESLYEYLQNMTDEDYNEYLKNIDLFFNSESIKQFSIENFISTIIKNIKL